MEPTRTPTAADHSATSALALAVLATIGGMALIGMLQPAWISGLINSFAGSQPKAFWYLSRSSGLAAYALLWGSMALGLAISNKMARAWRGGPTIAALHEYLSLLGLALTALHVAVLLWDGYANYSVGQLLIPFASAYRPLWIGLGQIGLYVLIPVTFSFYVRRWIGHRTWRRLHYLSFAVFVVALGHGVFSGTDSGAWPVQALYWTSAISVAGLLAYRISGPATRRAQPEQPEAARGDPQGGKAPALPAQPAIPVGPARKPEPVATPPLDRYSRDEPGSPASQPAR